MALDLQAKLAELDARGFTVLEGLIPPAKVGSAEEWTRRDPRAPLQGGTLSLSLSYIVVFIVPCLHTLHAPWKILRGGLTRRPSRASR